MAGALRTEGAEWALPAVSLDIPLYLTPTPDPPYLQLTPNTRRAPLGQADIDTYFRVMSGKE